MAAAERLIEAKEARPTLWRLGHDTLLAGDEDDWLYGGTGADSLDGGDGNDRLEDKTIKTRSSPAPETTPCSAEIPTIR